MSNLQKVIECLPHLKNEELLQVRSRIGFLLKHEAPKNNGHLETSSDELMVLDSIVAFLSSKGMEFSSVTLLKKSRYYSSFVEKLPKLYRYLNQSGLGKAEMRSLLGIGVRLLADDLNYIGAPISGGSLMAHIHRMPSAINRAFPGYVSSGALGFIVKRKGASHDTNMG